MNATSRCLTALGLTAALFSSCGGSSAGGGSAAFSVVEVSNGFGKLLPYRIAIRDSQGMPTSQVVEVNSFDQLLANLTLTNPIKTPVEWPVTTTLPSGVQGNHFIYARFSSPPDVASVLDSSSASAPGSLGDKIRVESINPLTGEVQAVPGVAFVGGQTFGPALDPDDPTSYLLQSWVVNDSSGGLVAVQIDGVAPGVGFPGTEGSFPGQDILLDPSTFLFVVDTDGDLSTHEAFPTGLQIQMVIPADTPAQRGRPLGQRAVASSTVGLDLIPPEVLVQGELQDPVIIPGNGAVDVDPQTNVLVQFTEPVQLLSVGPLDNGTPPSLSATIQLLFGPSSSKVQVPFTVRPPSILDLTLYELIPVYDFPGSGPIVPGTNCGSFGVVDVNVNTLQFVDLALTPNFNTLSRATSFVTREGPGIVNAPVTPDAIYVGRTGSNQGISVIDLNGFGAGTGNPAYDVLQPIIEGNTNYPNNLNVRLQGAQLVPPLFAGTCTFNGGSEGVFTLTKDSSLNDLLVRRPLLESVGDMALGHALDNTFNNESPFGCQAGGGNICAQSGLKRISIIPGGANTVASANTSTVAPIKTDDGIENLASWGPHPNPPPLSYPPLCLSPLINGVEPTSIVSFNQGFQNLLVPGDPFGDPSIGLPPTGLLTLESNSYYEGPSPPQPNIAACPRFMMRQQVGQFLYVVDRVAGEVVVFNSNRFTVLDRIRLPDPTSLAISPNLDFLAVTNERSDLVSFIDIDPSSSQFHTVIQTTRVGVGPTGIAWEPSNEDILVCNQGEGTVSILSGFSLEVRKTLRNQITRPIEVSITPRQQTFGLLRNLYFAYILNQSGKVAFFESGPDGVNGIGFDDVVGSLPFTFLRPKAMQADPTNVNSAVWIAHEQPLDGDGNPGGTPGSGALSNVGITGGAIGVIPLDSGIFGNPQLRQLQFGVLASVGSAQGLSGVPVDIAFDNMRNLSALTNFSTSFSAGTPASYNGKTLVKVLQGAPIPCSAPQFMFAAVPNPGVIDVFSITGPAQQFDTSAFSPGVQSIPAPNASVLMDYFRQ